MPDLDKITSYIELGFFLYSLNMSEYFDLVNEDGSRERIPFGHDEQINMDMVALAAQALGVSVDDILSVNTSALFKWYEKYSFFDCLAFLNKSFAKKFNDNKKDKSIFLKSRLKKQLKEMNEVYPGVYHSGASIMNLHIMNASFCHFDRIEELMDSFVKMVDRFKALFFKAWDENLEEDEINEYNIFVSTFGIRDRVLPKKGFLYYTNLKRCIPIYKEEDHKDLFDFIKFDEEHFFDPWRCAEFIENKNLIKAYFDILPEAKRLMRSFALAATQYKCFFSWSDAVENETSVYLPKTQEELGDEYHCSEEIIRLCRPEKLGGIAVKHPTLDIPAMAKRIGLIESHSYLNWVEDHYNIKFCTEDEYETGGGTNE